jgi:ribosomal-protein-alanine N-acetyltransferase
MPDRLPFVVEPMSLDDLDQVMEIEQVAFPVPWPAQSYHFEITESAHSTMLVVRPAPASIGRLARWLSRFSAVAQVPVVGYAGFWLLADEAHVATIAVHPTWRGQGLGELLLLSLLDHGAKLGARRATLEVRTSNTVAQGLYRKCGFEVISRRKRYYVDNDEDAYIMATPPFEKPAFRASLQQCRRRLYERLGEGRGNQDNPAPRQEDGLDKFLQMG